LQEREERRLSRKIYQHAANSLDSRGCLLLMRAMDRPLGQGMKLMSGAVMAAKNDELPCFCYTPGNNALPHGMPMMTAVEHAAVLILRYAVQQKDDFVWGEGVLRLAAYLGNVEELGTVLRAG
jgi:hypothetical protein